MEGCDNTVMSDALYIIGTVVAFDLSVNIIFNI